MMMNVKAKGKVTCSDECEKSNHAKLVDHHVRRDVRYQT